jgi:hypothetical protein
MYKHKSFDNYKVEIELSSLMHGRKNLERRDSVNDEVKD